MSARVKQAAARELEVALLPGVASASEVQLALEYGCDRLKFFPAEAARGPPLLQALYDPFPRVRFCPTGGINAQSAPAYLTLPNVVCVGGSWLAPKSLMEAGDWPAIATLAHASRALAGVIS
jgi:2-dehydro-3-deoxyphosphogluconate aldolase / (4S)-4-hydroxy-2-oxoglutarate aldolase